MQNSRYVCHILGKLEFSLQYFEKFRNIKFCKNPSIGSRIIPCGGGDGNTDRTIDRPIDGPTEGSTHGQV